MYYCINILLTKNALENVHLKDEFVQNQLQGHSTEMSIFLSLAFTEILHLKNTLGLQFFYILK